MQILAITSTILLLVSVPINIFLFLKAKKPSAQIKQSLELQEFLVDLMSGKMGMVAVARIDPNDVLLRSPRQK